MNATLYAYPTEENRDNSDPSRIKIVLDDGAFAPLRAHETDAGLDLRTPISVTVPAGDSVVIDTGVHIEIPRGYAGFLKSKSGLNVNHGIVSEGVIDAGYTGSIRAKLYNLSDVNFDFFARDKITQLVILPVLTPRLELVSSLSETERGDGGFGSTGR
jgi:dUTP pyrophosphatase